MKGPLAVLGAGGTFAGAAVAGLGIGIVLDHAFGDARWVGYCFFIGLIVGAYAAYRMLAQALK